MKTLLLFISLMVSLNCPAQFQPYACVAEVRGSSFHIEWCGVTPNSVFEIQWTSDLGTFTTNNTVTFKAKSNDGPDPRVTLDTQLRPGPSFFRLLQSPYIPLQFSPLVDNKATMVSRSLVSSNSRLAVGAINKGANRKTTVEDKRTNTTNGEKFFLCYSNYLAPINIYE